MSVTIHIPTPLRPFVGNQDSLKLEGVNSVDALVKQLVGNHPDLKKYLLDDQGKIRNFVNLYLNDEDIRYISGGATPIKDGDTLSIVPSIAGGRV